MKRILSFLTAMLLLAGMVVAPGANSVSATEEAPVIPDVCPCGCGVDISQLQWKPWDPNNAKLNIGGHFYLDGNYVQNEQFGISEGEKYVLDLRGCALSAADYGRLFLCNGFLAVLDTVGGGKMSAKTAGNGFGGVLLMQTNATFSLYGGTVTVDKDNKGSRRGGLISVGTNCSFNMYGGMLLGGSSQGTKAEEGGCVASYYTSGTIRILGGSVIGGYSPTYGGNIYAKGTTVLKDCRIIGGVADSYGGNLYQSGGSLSMENCVISDGVSKGTAATVTGGGNICAVSSAKVAIKNSTIRNGYAASYGGNMYYGSGTGTLENVIMTAGVSGLQGGNLRASANVSLTVTDCAFDGDVSCTGTLNVAGKTTIGLRNHGLRLGTNPLTAKTLAEGSEIYISGEGTITGGVADYFKPAIRTVLTQSENGLTASLAADGEVAGYCPHCGEQVSWTPFTASLLSQDGHYYLTGNQTAFSQKNINASIVLDLNSYDITSSGRVFFIQSGGVALLDSMGGGVVTAPGVANGHGGLIRNDGGNLQIFGGRYALAAGKIIFNGGILYTSGTTKIAGGIFDATVYSNDAYRGGVIYQVGGASNKLTICAGYFAGGKAHSGGTLHMGHNVTANITGGHFTGGSAFESGGNINVLGTSTYKKGNLNISDIAVTGGQSDISGGNVHITYYETAHVADSYIAGGSAASYGGNVLVSTNSTFVEYENCAVYGGKASRGGNIYNGSLAGRVRFINCELMDGDATANGGNLAINHGYVEILGGSMTGGTAGDHGGNIYSAAGSSNADGKANYLKLQKSESAPVIMGGRAGKNGGNVYFTGALQLSDGFIRNGTAATGADLYMAKASLQNILTVGEGVTGTMTMAVNADLLGSPVYGASITGSVATKLNATLYLEGEYGMPQICAYNGALVVAGAAKITGAESVGYATATEAAAACEAGEYVKLYTDTQLVMTRDCVLDLNGYAVTVSGPYTLYGMDSSADGFAGTGKAICGDGVQVESYTAPSGKIYVAVTQGEETTWHLLDMRITGVAIRPSVSGIYYTAKWNCDDTLLAQLDTYGLSVDTVRMPEETFRETGTGLWTEFSAAELNRGEGKTGAIISGILKEDRPVSLNDAYGKMPVFAAAYVTMKDGSVVVSKGVGYSLYSAMQLLETGVEQDPAGHGKYMWSAGQFYRRWKDMGMASWDFDRITIDPLCPWNYNVVEKAREEGKLHYYFMSGEWHAYSGGNSEPEKWGDSCLVVFPDGQTMLIDSGVSQYGPILVENLQRMGVTRLDHLVITHPHSDHQNGVFHENNMTGNGVLDLFEIGKVYHRGGYDSKNPTSSRLVETVCAERNLPLRVLEMGDTLQIGEVAIRVLWPKAGTSEKDTTGVNAAAANNASIVMRFDYQDHSSLFTGDLYIEREAEFVELYGEEVLDVDLLKAPHHGNGITSNSEVFLNTVSPELAVATGFENIQSKIRQRYTAAGGLLLDDRTYGYIHITTDGADMTYETSRECEFTEVSQNSQ